MKYAAPFNLATGSTRVPQLFFSFAILSPLSFLEEAITQHLPVGYTFAKDLPLKLVESAFAPLQGRSIASNRVDGPVSG